ncbi:hypothetical protein C1H46_032308 [Malus baccata]|uniref:U1 small nuclear ribonucleoprotein of 70kDa N-terminal domain-containing protein n=1 Tax=Malus baccata TaxID=106549 RepID=A0A540L6N7_MALBA|nr:hypothetical protein C1H46_032308 [Malus baccata]
MNFVLMHNIFLVLVNHLSTTLLVVRWAESHPTGLTTNLLKLFEPRPPLDFKPPPEKKKCPPLTAVNHLKWGLIGYCLFLDNEGVVQFVSKFAEPGDPEYNPPVQKGETPVTFLLESLV